jgi:hypothetical protein
MEKKERSTPFQAWNDYTDMAHKWRGEIINNSINLEQAIEKFIAHHYIIGITDEDYNKKLEDFIRIFFWQTNMGFGNKMAITKNLITLYQPELIASYHDDDVFAELQKIITTRNAMAHWQLDFSKEYRWEGAKNKVMKMDKLNKAKKIVKDDKREDINIYSEETIKNVAYLCIKYTNIFNHWNSYPATNALPIIYFATKERMGKLSDYDRAEFEKEYKK